MTYTDNIFRILINEVMSNGHYSPELRPVYSDGRHARTYYTTNQSITYNLADGEFPLLTLRPIPWKSAIAEMTVIYQDQSHYVKDYEAKGIYWWKDWQVREDGFLGFAYGNTVFKNSLLDNLLEGLEENPYSRRHIMNLWQEDDVQEQQALGGLVPCAFMTMFDVREVDGTMYLDCTLVQRSSDMLVALHINEIQYVALQMMIACHLGYEVGKFTHYIQNLHIYDNQIEQADTLMSREPTKGLKPKLVLNCPKGTNFYDIKYTDFEVVDYDPVKPQIKFDLAV